MLEFTPEAREVLKLCHERIRRTLASSPSAGLVMRECLTDKLRFLRTYACPSAEKDGKLVVDFRHTRCVLQKDFAPLSFFFTMQVREPADMRERAAEEFHRWFSGGLIFHGDVDDKDFTVPVGDGSWSIHT